MDNILSALWDHRLLLYRDSFPIFLVADLKLPASAMFPSGYAQVFSSWCATNVFYVFPNITTWFHKFIHLDFLISFKYSKKD